MTKKIQNPLPGNCQIFLHAVYLIAGYIILRFAALLLTGENMGTIPLSTNINLNLLNIL